MTELVDADGNERLFGYDTNGRVDSVTEVTNKTAGTGPTTTFTWQPIPSGTSSPMNSADEVVETDPLGHSTTYIDGYGGQALRVFDANGHYTSSTYSPDRQPNVLTDALLNQTTLTYSTDGYNNLKSEEAPASSGGGDITGEVANYNYNLASGTTGYHYLPSSAVDASGNCSAFSYDPVGNITVNRVGLPPGGTTPNCDGVTTGGYATTNAYQGDGSTTCSGQTGELCSTSSPAGNVTSYTYDASGELASVTQPGGSCTGTRLLCTSYTYDAASRVKTVTNGKNQVTTYSYDNDDRVTQVLSNGATSCVYSSGNCITVTYSPAGNLLTRQDSTGTTTYGYDVLDRLTSELLPANANACANPAGNHDILYTYDNANNLATYCDAGGKVNYTYDPANNLTGVGTDGGICTPGAVVQPCTSYALDPNNRVTGITWPTSTGASEAITYSNNGHVDSVKATEGATVLADLTYSYTNGTSIDRPLLQSVENNATANTTSYVYGNREFLTSATPTTGTTYTYSYGTNGNLTQAVGSATQTNSTMATGQLCWTLPSASGASCGSPPTGSTTYTTDASGNQTASTPPSGTGESISYNPLGQTSSVTPAGSSTAVAMTYTGANSTQRTQAGPTTFTNNAFGIAASTTSSTTTYFAYNPTGKPNTLNSMLVGTARYYYLYDGLGNIIGLINSSGTRDATYTYDPYGNTTTSGTEASANPFRFQGGYQDTTGYYKFGTRYYNPAIYGWTQPDPKPGSINNPTTLLRYDLDGNNPINNSDPTGEGWFDDFVSGAAGVVAGGAAFIASGGDPYAAATIGGCAAGATGEALAGGSTTDIVGGCVIGGGFAALTTYLFS
jgi:RHS repeat-associated protein